MDYTSKEIDYELLPFIRVYKDGSVDRLAGFSGIVPPLLEDPVTGVSTKDVKISQDPPISARLYLPKLTDPQKKIPIFVYFHGGGFCIESAFSFTETSYLKSLVSQAEVVAVSVEYRLAPEHPLPIAYEDSWAALQWVASHSVGNGKDKDPWILNHGDFGRVFIGGDSSGANIGHNIGMRAGSENLPGGVRLLGALFTHTYIWGSDQIGSESRSYLESLLPHKIWVTLYPSAVGGIDNPMINPLAPGAPSLAGFACTRLLLEVAEHDSFLLRDRGVLYHNAIKESGWKGDVELIEVKGEDHAFHILEPEKESSKILIKRLASFLRL
uniref:Catalytic n=1 Tax=Rhizophora mucronata TaxID=61149 RepID=A0A2P2PJ79_RHIMU